MPGWILAAESRMGRWGLSHWEQVSKVEAMQLREGPDTSKEHMTRRALRALEVERKKLRETLKDMRIQKFAELIYMLETKQKRSNLCKITKNKR
jgi:hypothetical protein